MISVGNKHHGATGENVMRPTPLGNPFKVRPYGEFTRSESILEYASWLRGKINRGDEKVLRELRRLRKIANAGDLTLVCCCAPQACHADVIKEVLEVWS